jgi:cytochrome c-type biogenesis protein CcsB
MKIHLAALAFLLSHPAWADTAPPAAPAAPAQPALPAAPHSGWDFSPIALTPIQNGGRIKPLDSYAREVVTFVTGRANFQGWDPVELIISWTANPESWENTQLILAQREDVKRQINLEEKRQRFTPAELLKNFALAQYADLMARDPSKLSTPPNIAQGELTKKNEREEELRRVIERLGIFHQHVAGKAWQIIPQFGDTPWLAVDSQEGGERAQLVRSRFLNVLQAYRANDQRYFDQYSKEFREQIESMVTGWSDSQRSHAKAEVLYNHLRPFQWSWVIYLIAGLLFVARSAGARFPIGVPLGATLAGMALHASGIALRCYIAGRPPVTNMYESVVWVSFGLLVFSMILYRVTRNFMAPAVASFDPSIRPLVPVLRSNYWLTIHVLTITLGYAAFALTSGIANVTLFQFVKPKSGSQAKVMQLNQLAYRSMQFGVVLLAAGTILGGIWADASWGRFWGWDPKEVWALIALLSYVTILHARFTGWVDQFGFTVLTVAAFMSVLMAWYGVNFILGKGLHSYGFSSGGATFVATFVTLQLGYIAFVALARKGRLSRTRVSRASGGAAVRSPAR